MPHLQTILFASGLWLTTVNQPEAVTADNKSIPVSLSVPYDTMLVETGYHKNGKVKVRTTTFYDRRTLQETKCITERFGKDGKKQSVHIVDEQTNPVYYAKYIGGELAVERRYTYSAGILVRVETRINGETRVQEFEDPNRIN